MSDIILKDGHLFKDGKKLKLEFGNKEQIEALRRFEKSIEKFKVGVEPEVTYNIEAAAHFVCVCKHRLAVGHFPVDDIDEVDCFEDLTKKCHNCNREYKFVLKKNYKLHFGRSYLDSERLYVTFL